MFVLFYRPRCRESGSHNDSTFIEIPVSAMNDKEQADKEGGNRASTGKSPGEDKIDQSGIQGALDRCI